MAAAEQLNRKDSRMFSGLLQPTHLIVLVVIALVFLGPKRLPEAGRALGQGLKEFKNSIGGGHDDDHRPAHTSVTPAEKAPSP
jgi:sec-independent protein translocase protein TatA